jgi:NADH oxidase (H2O2-forming)
MKLLIIGSGAAGLTAAQFARKTDRQAEITVLGNEGCGEYSKCGLPYVIGGVLPSLDDLIEFPVAWFQRFNIDVRPESEASDVDPEVKAVTAISLRDGGEEQYLYDVLLIATGASSWIPDVKGTFASGGELREGILALRTMGDARRILEQVQNGNRAMIVGSGLIGMEMAEALSLRGMRTYVRLRTHLLAGMVDEDMAAIVQNRAEQRGIHFIPRSTVSEIGGVRRMESVLLRNLDTGEESEYPVDLVIISAGSRPRVEIARKAGCRIGATGAIAVDERCMTSVNNVFAAGDCTEYPDLVTGRPVAIGLGSIGVRQGRVAGVNAAGGMGRLPRGVLNNRTTELFGLEISAVGPTMKELRSAGIEAVVGKCNGWTLPDYFPGKKAITLKVMADLEHGRIVAAQIVGEEDVHQRINVFAAAILNGMTLEDFLGLETCYAPPAAPTLDPMTLAADAALAKWRRR